MRGFFSEDFLLVFGQHVPAEVSLLDGRTQWISCLFLHSSDWKAGSCKLTLQKWPVFTILEAAYNFFSYKRRQRPTVLSWRTMETVNVVSGLSEMSAFLSHYSIWVYMRLELKLSSKVSLSSFCWLMAC